MKTTLAVNPGADRTWWVVDAQEKILGRMSTRIANVLRGKDKPTYSPHVDTGDFVIVVNAAKVKLSGNKDMLKMYQRYTGHRGGRKLTSAAEMREKDPERFVKMAVRGMLPKNNISRQHLSRLKVYAGESHPHAAQNPKAMAEA